MSQILSFEIDHTKQYERHELDDFRAFLKYHVEEKGLPIGKYLPLIGAHPFFIVAATGVGKTVGVPMHLFILLCDSLYSKGKSLNPLPQVYVVEPTIPICTREMEHMNESYHKFVKEFGGKNPSAYNPFGLITSTVSRNINAPVLFITTGVFERKAKNPNLRADRVRFILDEAHRTLMQSDGVEIAVALAKKRGIIVDFMSATVDTTTLSKDLGVQIVSATERRFPILLKSTKVPLEHCICDLAVRCLLRPDQSEIPKPELFSREEDRCSANRVRLHLLSKNTFMDPDNGKSYPGLIERPQGMLIIVNSYKGEQSDTKRIYERLKETFHKENPDVEILILASPIIRDSEKEESFKRRVEGIEKRNGRYVIVATNVVEMGVTFPSLDYVVTMDTELESVEQYGGDVIHEKPLSVNGLFQRTGRVGRNRPGMAFITREDTKNNKNSDYSLWNEDKLAINLKLEPIQYAIQQGKIRELAFFLFESSVPLGIEASKTFLSTLPFPSAPHQNPSVLKSLESERFRIQNVGFSDNGTSLNDRGNKYREIAVVQDMHLGKLLAHCCIDKNVGNIRYLALVSAASESITFKDILAKRTYLGDISALNLRVPFSKDEFKKPLEFVWETLKSIKEPYKSNMSKIETSEQTANRIYELLKEEFVAEKPIASSKTGEPVVFYLSKPVIQLDNRSELISAYNIVAYFFNKYRSDIQNSLYNKFEVARVRHALREECLDIGVNPFAVELIIRRIAEIARHAKITLYSETNENANKISDESIKTALKLQFSIDCAAGRVKQEDIPTLLKNVENHALIPQDLYKYIKMTRKDIRDILKQMWSFQPKRRSEYLPNLSEDDIHQLLNLVQVLNLFESVDLRKETDYRGNEQFIGNTQAVGGSITVELDLKRTSIRSTQTPFRVRGKIFPIPYMDNDGEECVRYILGYTTLVTRGIK